MEETCVLQITSDRAVAAAYIRYVSSDGSDSGFFLLLTIISYYDYYSIAF